MDESEESENDLSWLEEDDIELSEDRITLDHESSEIEIEYGEEDNEDEYLYEYGEEDNADEDSNTESEDELTDETTSYVKIFEDAEN